VGILGDAARKARRDAAGTGRESSAEGEAGAKGGDGAESEEGRAESGSREEKSCGKAARSEGKETQMNRAPLIGLALASALAAPAFAPAPLRADDTVKVAIGQINNWENQAPTLGQDAGIFKKYGLTLETFGTAGAGETLQPIISGSADIGIGVGVAGAMRAFAGGAPVRILAPAFTGSSDLFWYVRPESPIKTLADATPANTVAYSTNGSSSHNLVLAFVDELGLKAKPTPTGSPPATLTAVMSGQIDIGWSAPPIGLQEVKDGRLRLIARGSDAPSLRGQTVRVTVVNANFLKQRPDVAARFVKAYRETVDWMYSDPKALELYAKKIDKPLELVKQTIAQFYPKDVLQTDQMADMPGILRDAVKLKYLREPLAPAQVTELVKTPPR
jgi:NitT/TauT family transport system substrate-binding protein